MKAFDPFKKKFEDIEVEDLSVLSEVAEGWYVEYKRELPSKIHKIAKSISSFSQEKNIIIPSGFEYEDYIKVDKLEHFKLKNQSSEPKEIKDSEKLADSIWLPQMFLHVILHSLGLPIEVTLDDTDSFLTELIGKTITRGLGTGKAYNINWIRA